MNSIDEAKENLEEAYFAYLMARIMKAEGAALLAENERLKHDPSFVVPESLHERSLETINREFRAKKLRYRRKNLLRTLLVAALVSTLLFTTAYATNENVRAVVTNIVIDITGIAGELKFVQEGEEFDREKNFDRILAGYVLPNIPDDYVIDTEGIEQYIAWRRYVSTDYRGYIEIRIIQKESMFEGTVDVEDAVITEQSINGYRATIIEKTNRNQIVLIDLQHLNYIVLSSNEKSIEEMIDMAQDVKYLEN